MSKGVLALTICFVCILVCAPSIAFDADPIGAGIRVRVSSEDVLGEEQPEAFDEYDLWATFRLPWQAYGKSSWGVGTRLLTSAGYLEGAGSGAVVLSVIPLVALGSQ